MSAHSPITAFRLVRIDRIFKIFSEGEDIKQHLELLGLEKRADEVYSWCVEESFIHYSLRPLIGHPYDDMARCMYDQVRSWMVAQLSYVLGPMRLLDEVRPQSSMQLLVMGNVMMVGYAQVWNDT